MMYGTASSNEPAVCHYDRHRFGKIAKGGFAALSVIVAALALAACAPAQHEIEQVQTAPQTQVLEETYTAYFGFNSDKLDGKARKVVAEAAAWAMDSGNSRIVISGHADRMGPAEYNNALSKARVAAVAVAFSEAGIPDSKIETQVFGEASPQVPTADEKASAKNRRAEIRVVKTLDERSGASSSSVSEAKVRQIPGQTCSDLYVWSVDSEITYCMERWACCQVGGACCQTQQ